MGISSLNAEILAKNSYVCVSLILCGDYASANSTGWQLLHYKLRTLILGSKLYKCIHVTVHQQNTLVRSEL